METVFRITILSFFFIIITYTIEGREADILMKRIEAYEDIHYPIKGSLYD